MIYFVQTCAGGPIKIGFTERPTDRFSQLRWEFDAIMGVLGVMPGGLDVETATHQQFAHLLAPGVRAKSWGGYFCDWYHPWPDLLAFIAAHCVPWDGTNEREQNGCLDAEADPLRPLSRPIPIGSRFSRLTVIGEPVSVKKDGKGRAIYYPCRCDCGTETRVRSDGLTGGHTTSCGCWNRHRVSVESRARMTTHGETKTALYKIRNNMLMRCRKLGTRDTRAYGDRGIDVCPEWRGSWEAFRDWAHANGYEEGLTLDRTDVNGNYCPENCRWVTMRENRKVNHQSSVYLEAFGERKTIGEWVEDARCSVQYRTLWKRLVVHGWGAERAISEPCRIKDGWSVEMAIPLTAAEGRKKPFAKGKRKVQALLPFAE